LLFSLFLAVAIAQLKFESSPLSLPACPELYIRTGDPFKV
jgi:hypothetical protein